VLDMLKNGKLDLIIDTPHRRCGQGGPHLIAGSDSARHPHDHHLAGAMAAVQGIQPRSKRRAAGARRCRTTTRRWQRPAEVSPAGGLGALDGTRSPDNQSLVRRLKDRLSVAPPPARGSAQVAQAP